MRWMGPCFALTLAVLAWPVAADPPAERQVFDSWNDGGCGVTNIAFIDIAAPTHLTRVHLKLMWDGDETQMPFTVTTWDNIPDDTTGEKTLGGGVLARGDDCDPRKEGWCSADGAPNLDLAPGTYKIITEREAICQDPDSRGSGFLRAFGYPAGGGKPR